MKKLLVEGIPSSVRHLIWSYLSGGKGRAVKGVIMDEKEGDAETLPDFAFPDGEAGMYLFWYVLSFDWV